MRASRHFFRYLCFFGSLSLGCESLLGMEPTILTATGSAAGSSGTVGQAGARTAPTENPDAVGGVWSEASAGSPTSAPGAMLGSQSAGVRSMLDDPAGGRSVLDDPAGAAGGEPVQDGGLGGISGAGVQSTAGGPPGGGDAGAAGNGDTGKISVAGLGRRALGAIVADDDRCLGIGQARGSQITNPSVVLEPCGDDPKQRWVRDADSRLAAPDLGSASLTAPEAPAVAEPMLTGVAAASALEPPDPTQVWTFEDVLLVNDGGLCLDVTNNEFSDNAPLELYACHSDAPQLWTISSSGQIAQQSFCIDLPSGNDGDDTVFDIYTCHTPASDNQRFVLRAGRLKPLGSLKCVTASDEAGSNPSLQLEGCDNSRPRPPLQSFHIRGPIRNQGLCLTMSGESAAVALATCDGSHQQLWDYYF